MDFQGNNNPFAQAGLGQLGSQSAPEHPAMSVFRKYVSAKQEYDEACHAYAQAEQRRTKASEVLTQLTQAVNETIQRGMADPTVPSAPQPTAGYQRI